MTAIHKKIIPFLLLIAILTLAYSLWIFQTQIADAQKQAVDLQNQLTYYENSTNTLQTHVSNLESQFRDLQNPICNVTIESVTSEPWFVPVGMAMFKELYVTVKNVGVRDVGGLTFVFKILANDTVWDSEYYEVGMTAPDQLGVLHVQESTIIRAEIRSSIGVSFAGKTFVVTVMLDKTVLDERTLPLSAGFPEP